MTVRLGTRSARVIDCHCHLDPPDWQQSPSPASIYDLEAYLEAQERAGIDTSVFGHNWIRTPPSLAALEVMRRYNQFAAELTARYPERLQGLACAVPFGDDAYLRETERAVQDLGLKGIAVNSSVQGHYLDSPRVAPFLELVSALDVPLFVHPPRVTIGHERMEFYRLPEMVGRPFDTTLSLARFILGGGFERFPGLKLVCAHMGGAISLLAGRLDFGYELRDDPAFGPWEPDLLSAPPSTHIRRLYVDTMGFHPPAILCCASTVGADHVVLGSDFPPVAIPLSRTVEAVRDLPLSVEDRAAIMGGNAARLLKI